MFWKDIFAKVQFFSIRTLWKGSQCFLIAFILKGWNQPISLVGSLCKIMRSQRPKMLSSWPTRYLVCFWRPVNVLILESILNLQWFVQVVNRENLWPHLLRFPRSCKRKDGFREGWKRWAFFTSVIISMSVNGVARGFFDGSRGAEATWLLLPPFVSSCYLSCKYQISWCRNYGIKNISINLLLFVTRPFCFMGISRGKTLMYFFSRQFSICRSIW